MSGHDQIDGNNDSADAIALRSNRAEALLEDGGGNSETGGKRAHGLYSQLEEPHGVGQNKSEPVGEGNAKANLKGAKYVVEFLPAAASRDQSSRASEGRSLLIRFMVRKALAEQAHADSKGVA